jgi:hypothetical protein
MPIDPILGRQNKRQLPSEIEYTNGHTDLGYSPEIYRFSLDNKTSSRPTSL